MLNSASLCTDCRFDGLADNLDVSPKSVRLAAREWRKKTAQFWKAWSITKAFSRYMLWDTMNLQYFIWHYGVARNCQNRYLVALVE